MPVFPQTLLVAACMVLEDGIASLVTTVYLHFISALRPYHTYGDTMVALVGLELVGPVAQHAASAKAVLPRLKSDSERFTQNHSA